MSDPRERRLPTPVLAEDLADAWSTPRARDLAYVRPPRPTPSPEHTVPEADQDEAA